MGGEAVGVDVEVAVSAGVREALALSIETRLAPAGPPSAAYRAERGVQVNENVGLEALPEVWYT